MTPAEALSTRLLRNLFLWTIVCGFAAVPSFLFAYDEFDEAGMVLGVVIYILAYTAVSSTAWAQRLKAQRAWRYTFYVVYGTRVAMSLLLLPMFAMDPSGTGLHGLLAYLAAPAMSVDVISGIISVGIGGMIVAPFSVAESGFTMALVATLVQGAVLNVILGFYMLIVFGIVRVFVGKRYIGSWQCPVCGYDLRGSQQSEACPECGQATPWAGAGGGGKAVP